MRSPRREPAAVRRRAGCRRARAPLAWLCALLAGAAAGGCIIPGVGMSYAEHKQRVAEIVDATYRATMAGRPVSRGGEVPWVPCVSAVGATTGDYGPKGDIEVALGPDADRAAIAERVRRHWERAGYEITSVGEDNVILARDGDYQLSLRVYPKSDVANIGATGPCATPASDAERDARPEFRSVTEPDSER